MSRPSPCPLCHYATLKPFAEDKRRHYMQCPCCHLVSVPPQYHLSCCDEKAEYDKHDNHAADAGYIRFYAVVGILYSLGFKPEAIT